MNPAHLHLLLNHVPILGSVFAVALLLWAIARRADEVARVALAALVVIAALTVPVYKTGEPAEKKVEHLPGVSERWIHQHEDIAKVAGGAAMLAGLVAAIGLIAFRAKPVPVGFTTVVLLLSLGTAGLMATTGWHGGHIRHTEVRPAGADSTAAGSGAGEAVEHED